MRSKRLERQGAADPLTDGLLACRAIGYRLTRRRRETIVETIATFPAVRVLWLVSPKTLRDVRPAAKTARAGRKDRREDQA